ncbi:hypothetical protein B0H66DRAFT_630892 [Apodospora peruviana]|uniref:Transposase n=1 Tax=Apodospora peruviana TaxID=516989 RepID=A0AAE0M0F0_9PEZI|nr:hypothetical protein B0H66DRAFT_630892 [Apodospora peruviana]
MKLDLDEFITDLAANREKNKELTPIERAVICTLVASGAKGRSQIASMFRLDPKTVNKTVENWQAHRSFDTRPRSGRPRCSTRPRNLRRLGLLPPLPPKTATQTKTSAAKKQKPLPQPQQPQPPQQAETPAQFLPTGEATDGGQPHPDWGHQLQASTTI